MTPTLTTRRSFLHSGAAFLVASILAGCQAKTPTPTRIPTSRPSYPLKRSPGKRYLLDQKDQPVLVQGDTPWSLISGLTKPEAQEYLANRAQKGFNSLIVNLIEHKFNGPRNREGNLPFTTPERLSGPVEAYFAHADWVMKKAAEASIQIFLAPIYLGYDDGKNDQGWYNEVLAAGVEGCREWGRYVGKRYGSYDNLVWLIGGDRNPGEAAEPVNAFVAGIKEFDTRHLLLAHPAPGNSAVSIFGEGGWLTLNGSYTYDSLPAMLRADAGRQRSQDIPFVLLESTYENEHNATSVQIRRQAYWAVLFGAAGQFFGNYPIWSFNNGWQQAMEGEGSWSMMVLNNLFLSRPWQDLVPDVDHSTLDDGRQDGNNDDTLAAAISANGDTLVAYMPSARTVRLDLSRISGGKARLWWYDPRSGKASAAGEFFTQGKQDFTPPSNGDWVLVADDAGKNFNPPGV